MEQVLKQRKLGLTDSQKPDCRMCNKNVVCTLYRGITTLIDNNWQGQAKPFSPADVANICKYFAVEYKENL